MLKVAGSREFIRLVNLRLSQSPAGRGVLIAVWVLSVLTGFIYLWNFAYTPGASASNTPRQWPAHLARPSGRPTLVVFAHPRCSCSNATVDQLAQFSAHYRNLAIRIYFYTPENAAADWIKTSLWNDAVRVPGAQVEKDPGGKMALQFGAQTSGQSLLYDSQGSLVFAGGLTSARGHYGENDGSDAISAWLRGEAPKHASTPVFGCGLHRAS